MQCQPTCLCGCAPGKRPWGPNYLYMRCFPGLTMKRPAHTTPLSVSCHTAHLCPPFPAPQVAGLPAPACHNNRHHLPQRVAATQSGLPWREHAIVVVHRSTAHAQLRLPRRRSPAACRRPSPPLPSPPPPPTRFLAFLRDEEERERLEEVERLKPIGTPVGSYLEYRCKAEVRKEERTGRGGRTCAHECVRMARMCA